VRVSSLQSSPDSASMEALNRLFSSTERREVTIARLVDAYSKSQKATDLQNKVGGLSL
jgi:hypothetical protein